jgi:hypothetical protein
VFGWHFADATGFPDCYLYAPEPAGVGGAIGRRGSVHVRRAKPRGLEVDA